MGVKLQVYFAPSRLQTELAPYEPLAPETSHPPVYDVPGPPLSITTSAETALTVTVTVAVFDTAPWPSATVYRNVSVPVNVPLGV